MSESWVCPICGGTKYYTCVYETEANDVPGPNPGILRICECANCSIYFGDLKKFNRLTNKKIIEEHTMRMLFGV